MSTLENGASPGAIDAQRLADLRYINLKLAALGWDTFSLDSDEAYLTVADSLLKNYSRQQRLLSGYRCPADQRIQDFLNAYLREHGLAEPVSLPGETFILDKPGLARELSLPLGGNHFKSSLVESFRLVQGVLHNPRNDRRTTKGVFHIVAGGLPVPADKREVPVRAFAALLRAAVDPPEELLGLPLTSDQQEPTSLWVSLLARPLVRPAVAGVLPAKTMETRVFAPGGLVSNLDFLESIFGNGGDPFLPEHDVALDIDHWTGHSGCIILAPHLIKLRKQELGLPHYSDASERQRRDGMCWQQEDELYNDGSAFKVVCRDMRGVVVTIIADNYFGYSKKEIKSQISYSANLFGGCEEEHSGGALAFPSFNLGETYQHQGELPDKERSFATLCEQLAPWIEVQPNGCALDRQHDDIVYIREDASIDIPKQRVSWSGDNGRPESIKLLAGHTYVYPSGFKVHMERHPHAPSWRLIGTLGEGTFLHKPSTVSGGGKSEISKSSAGTLISGAVYIDDIDRDLEQVAEIFDHDYSKRFRYPQIHPGDTRSLLSSERSLGSVIKLLTPSISEYTDEYNAWLEGIPQHILALVFMIKRFYNPAWGPWWRSHFSVDDVNGYPSHELKLDGRKLIASNLRVGLGQDGNWRVYKLRQDFVAAEKVQMEDDITASTVVPVNYVEGLNPDYSNPCVKLVENCEASLFQRPDEAVNRGLDLQTERDLAGENNFISNFEPLTVADARELLEDVVNFEAYSEPMKQLIRRAAQAPEGSYFVSSAHPRMVGGKPSLNVRYLQRRPDLADPRRRYLAEIGTRLARGLRPEQPVYFPVNAVIPGRRNNPSDTAGIRPLAVYNPIHYQELPELFMDFICSLTGKSPSTTGAGSEGALTKGPFNCLATTADLNTALVSYILCGYHGFSTAAGYIGAHRRIDHDISLLIPEIWCRLPVEKREPAWLIEHGYLQKMEDFEYQGRTVYASRLGYRITEHFVHDLCGKVFDRPSAVFDEAMLCPETQDLRAFIDGVDNIHEAQQRVALAYFEDGSVNDACPPLQALLHIMAYGNYRGKGVDEPGIREMFSRDYLLHSDWYEERLIIKQTRDERLWRKHQLYLEQQLEAADAGDRERLVERIQEAQRMRQVVSSSAYLKRLQGTLGADWIHRGSAVV